MSWSVDFLLPSEVPALFDLCEEQNRRDGTSYEPPEIFTWNAESATWEQGPNVPLAVKVTRNGRMLGGYTFERRLEFSSFGTDPKVTAAGLRELPAAMVFLKKLGYTGFHSAVPLTFVDQWERTLAKRLRMTRDDHRLAHFYRSFRERS